MRVTLITNPVSGAGTGSQFAARAEAAFIASGHTVERVTLQMGDDVARVARAAADAGTDRVVAIGGDGTVADVAAGLLAARRRCELAILPLGTANILALNLGIPHAPGDAIAVAAGGVPLPIDCGRVGGEVFLLSVGTGLHAEMIARADRAAKQRWGVAAYGLAGWRANFVTKPVRYLIDCDGEIEEYDSTMVQVMNCGVVLRKEWGLAPGISPIDGVLDVLIYRATKLPHYLVAAALVVRGRPTETPLVVHRRAARVRIEADPPVRVQRDGEMAGSSPVEIAVDPRALTVVVPAGSPWGAA